MSYVLKLKGKHDEPPQKPDDVIAVQIDALGGGFAKKRTTDQERILY